MSDTTVERPMFDDLHSSINDNTGTLPTATIGLHQMNPQQKWPVSTFNLMFFGNTAKELENSFARCFGRRLTIAVYGRNGNKMTWNDDLVIRLDLCQFLCTIKDGSLVLVRTYGSERPEVSIARFQQVIDNFAWD